MNLADKFTYTNQLISAKESLLNFGGIDFFLIVCLLVMKVNFGPIWMTCYIA